MAPEFQLAAAGFAVLLALIAIRCPVGLAMLLVGAGGYAWIVDTPTLLNVLKTTPYHLFANYTLSVIPLFILMGALAEGGGQARDLFTATNLLVGRWRGGMAMGVIGASAAFSAVSGSSVATTATFGRATLPELRRFGYDPGFACATIAVGGTLGILIPPSIILVIYAISTEQNIAKLFMASLIPGVLATGLYMVAIAIVARWRPESAPPGRVVGGAERAAALRGALPILGIAFVVLGGIYGGVFTPTESAAIGALATLAVGLLQRRLGFFEIRAALIGTAETTAMIFVILLGAELFNSFLALTGAPELLAVWITEQGYSAYGVLTLLLFAYIVLGAVMDELAMMLLTLPVFFPVVVALDFGLGGGDETALWFGILVLTVVGIGLTAPPIGLNVFVISSLARDVPMARIYRGAMPFLTADLVRLALLVAFPGLSLWLVRVLS